MEKKSITYIFGNGRTEKIKSSDEFASEFFYGYIELLNENEEIEIIENNLDKSKTFSKLFLIVDKILRKLTNLPFYFNEICSFRNLKKTYQSDVLIITNDRLALSMIPLLIIVKLFKSFQINVFVMGFFGKERPKYFYWLQKFFMVVLIKLCNNFLFLGMGEFNSATNKYKKYKEKFKYFPFCVDYVFWTKDLPNYNKKLYSSDIIFVGNDGNRDFSMLIEIARNLPKLKFNILSSEIQNNLKLPENINLIKSNWNQSLLSDNEMRKYFSESKISIIPLKNSLQPSGQSVALQSMVCKTPVMISKTKGFWDDKLFKNNENIIFIQENSVGSWVEKINESLNNIEKLNEVSKNSYSTVSTKLTMENFVSRLWEIIND